MLYGAPMSEYRDFRLEEMFNEEAERARILLRLVQCDISPTKAAEEAYDLWHECKNRRERELDSQKGEYFKD